VFYKEPPLWKGDRSYCDSFRSKLFDSVQKSATFRNYRRSLGEEKKTDASYKADFSVSTFSRVFKSKIFVLTDHKVNTTREMRSVVFVVALY